jgi:hypothetical protein
MSSVAGSNNSYKPITNTAWFRARLRNLQKGALDSQLQKSNTGIKQAMEEFFYCSGSSLVHSLNFVFSDIGSSNGQ